ncbi:hypothetical protein CCR75_007606 [Bremia lactucae]|uniref:Origin recognition complex subunit 3 n=1 Tax=Bremia lactucae TaxID=4779 RepID=A0A976IL89_BRELC|nr:hypothetical protein CCR75_007606 [Bremia lactucae]
MEPAAYTTGVTIQFPQKLSNASASSIHYKEQTRYPFPFPKDSNTSTKRQSRADTEAYSVYQELAYHHACEITRQSVQKVLQQSNDVSYNQMLQYFEKYCAQTELADKGDSLRRQNIDAQVLFPAFHAYPSAAVIAGTDATSSDLWIEPLTLQLRRTFPLCIKVPRDAVSARRLIEWLTKKLAKVLEAIEREETWLKQVVDTFDLLPLDHLVGPVRRSGRTTRQQYNTKIRDNVVDSAAKNVLSEDSIAASSLEWDSSDEEVPCEAETKKTRKKRRAAPVPYGRWTMSQLLTRIQYYVNEVIAQSSSHTRREWVAMIEELVLNRLEKAFAIIEKDTDTEGDRYHRSLACLDEAVSWLQTKIDTCRSKAPKLLNVARMATDYVSITEMALAKILQRVFRQYTFLVEKHTLSRPMLDDPLVSRQQEMAKHEQYYALEREECASLDSRQPYLLLCIDQLEAFSQQVLGDFLDIWTHFSQQQETLPLRYANGTLGFVIGVASANSPALRRLDLTITKRLELQFFSLLDSRKCFEHVLESLVVCAKLPLQLSGNVVRAIAHRHSRLPSVPRLLLALRLLLFTHFRRCPWSFLAFAVDSGPTCENPLLRLATQTPLPHRVTQFIQRHGHKKWFKAASTLDSWLARCSAVEIADLTSRVLPSNSSNDWNAILTSALVTARQRRDSWRLGWECFRAACVLFHVCPHDTDESDGMVLHLSFALEGRLYEARCFQAIIQSFETCKWRVAINLIQQWRASVRGLNLEGDTTFEPLLGELATLCAYASSQESPASMLRALRRELVTVFTTRLVAVLLHPRGKSAKSKADTLVEKWSIVDDATVLDERLRLEYHDHIRQILQDAGIEENSTPDGNSAWLHDVGLAFLFYQESASSTLNLLEWYECFSSELQEEEEARNARQSTKVRKNDGLVKARFVRALCTLRHWGFLKNDGHRDFAQEWVEKLVFL